MAAKKKTKTHQRINGQLLQMNKTFSHLKQKQKLKINEWLYQEYKTSCDNTGKMPNKEADLRIIFAVTDKIIEANIWLPAGELDRYYYRHKNKFHKRYEKAQQVNND